MAGYYYTYTVGTYEFTDGDEDFLDLALLHYCFDNEEHTVLTRPHGNSKSDTGFVRTMPSTLSKVRELSENLKPKHVVAECQRNHPVLLNFQEQITVCRLSLPTVLIEITC